MRRRNHLGTLIITGIALLTISFLSKFGMKSLAGPSEDADGQNGNTGNAPSTYSVTGNDGPTLSDFEWFLNSMSYDAFEGIYYYSMHPLAQEVTDRSKLEGTWDMVIYHHPDQTSMAPAPLFLGKEIGKLYIENVGGDNLRIRIEITEAIPDRPGDANPVNENNLVINGFWNNSGIINANIEGGGGLDIYSFFTLPDERIHATGKMDIMTADKNIYWAYLGLNKVEERQLRGDAGNQGQNQSGQGPAGPGMANSLDSCQSYNNTGAGGSISNDEIVERAKKHSRAPFAELDSIDPDGTLNIHLYEQTGGHIATWDWYYINPNTLKGTNILGNDIDLSNVY